VAGNPTSWNSNAIVVPAPVNGSTGSVVVTVGGNASNGVNFTYSPTGAVSGSVTRASDGSAVNGATIQVLQSGIVQGSTTTSGTGAYSIGSLVPGVYDLHVTASGYSAATQTANLVVAGQTTTINIALRTPNIASLSPLAGPVGTSVAIVGSGFGVTQSGNSITFNGTTASASSWTDTKIVTAVPSGATSGSVVVTVGGTASNGVSFTVGIGGIAGTITRTSDGAAVSGALVEALLSNASKGSITSASNGSYTISNLSPGTYDVRVTASGYGTAIQTGIIVSVGSPATANVSLSAAGTISGKVTTTDGVTAVGGASINVLKGTDTAGSSATNTNGNYSITTIAPGNYSVQASAAGFNSQTQTGVSVTAGNTTTTNFTLSGQSLVSYSYDALGRLVGVSDSRSNTAVYDYDAVGNLVAIGVNPSSQVSIINFLPQTGAVGTIVTINGTGFSSTASQDTVKFNGTSATISSASPTQIAVAVPSGATSGPITVTAPNGSATSTTNFTVTASTAPVITGFTPSIGTAGTVITISGANFDPTAANDKTKLNLLSTLVSSATATSISTSVPTAATSGHISLKIPTGTFVTSSYFFVPPPPNSVASVGFTGSIAVGSSVNVAINTAGQIGLLAFDGTAGEAVSVVATNNTYACFAMTFTILNPDGSSLASGSACGTTGWLNSKTLPTTGTYTVYVNPTSSTGAATFTLTQNITESLALNTPLNVSSSLAGQVYDLTFSGTAGEVVSVAATNNTYACFAMTFTILNPDGSSLASGSVCGTGGSLSSKTLPTTGTYTVYVNPTSSTGAATFTLTSP
jgi:YD repeat-containing protein